MYITCKTQSIFYQKIGKGKDLIMLHGWNNDTSSFWQVSNMLKDKFTVWLIDLPGFGRSENPKSAFKVSDYAEIIKEFITQLKIKKPIVLGHSMGGRVTIKLAAKYPDLLSKIILESSAGIRPKRDTYKLIFYILTKFFKYIIPDIFNLREKVRFNFYKSIKSDYLTVGSLKDIFVNVSNEDLTLDLPKVQNDALLIWGEKDPTHETSPENGKKMYQLIKNSRIEILGNVGHFPHLENPERFVYYVEDFC